MTNQEFLNGSVFDLSKQEKDDVLVMAKNLVDYMIKSLPADMQEQALNEYVSAGNLITLLEISKKRK